MMWFSHAALLLLLAFVGPALSRDRPPPDGTGNLASPCAATCVNNVFSSAEKFGCAVGDTICVCEKAPDFENGIKDCVVQACIGPLGESQDQITHAQDHGADVCNDAYWDAGILPWGGDEPAQPPPEQTSTPPAEASPTPASETPPAPEATTTSAAPSTDAGASTTPEPAPESSASTSPAPPAETPSAESSTSQPSSSTEAGLTAAGETTLATKTSISSSATASKSGAAATNTSLNSNGDDDNDPKPEGAKLSNKTIAIIVGVSVFLFLAAIVVAILMWCRKRRAKKVPPPLNISQPLPGSGRQFAGDESSQEKDGGQAFPAAYSSPGSTTGSFTRSSHLPVNPTEPRRSSYSSELDREARRYEDMPPRAQPRMMI